MSNSPSPEEVRDALRAISLRLRASARPRTPTLLDAALAASITFALTALLVRLASFVEFRGLLGE